MASRAARLHWKNGVSLSEAWRHFASERDQDDLSELPRPLDAMANLSTSHAGGGVKAIAEAVTLGIKAAQARRELEDRLREELLTELFNNQLIATGFREQPSLSSAPVAIDAEHFDYCSLDWANCKLAANGRVWNRVRISPPIAPTPRAVPNSSNAITIAIHKLDAENSAFAKARRKTQCDLVRQQIGAEYVSGNGLSDPNIAKHIVRIIGIKRITNGQN